MKKLLYTSILSALLIGACKPKKKEEEPKATASITLNAIHSAQQYQNRSNTFYKGDTIRYDIVVSSDKDVSNFEVTVNGVSKLSKSSFTSSTSFTERFTYVVEQNSGESVEVMFKVKESTDKETTKSISFSVSDLVEYKNLKVFNKASIAGADSLRWYFKYAPRYSNNPFIEERFLNYFNNSETGVEYRALIFQSSVSFSPSDNTKNFYRRIASPYSNSTSFRCRYIKTNQTYESFLYPNQIVDHFQNNQNLSAGNLIGSSLIYIDPVAVNDVYIMEFDDLSTSGVEGYFVIKFTDIVDDAKTSDTAGDDNDYMKFDIKYFYSNRF